MGIHYAGLNSDTRHFMVQEVRAGGHYESPRLTAEGLRIWPMLLEEAATAHNDDWLAGELLRRNLLRTQEAYNRAGATHTRRINQPQAAEQLAEGEFNRYYLRGLCLRAIRDGVPVLVVYRGKAVAQPRPESEALIGREVPVDVVLNHVRSNDFVSIEEVAGGVRVPGGPNSGITCRLPGVGTTDDVDA